jgi:predicted CopG family antitoxin
MVKKLTITVDEDVYAGLHERIGPRRISRFINDLARPHVTEEALVESYRQMAADELQEKEAEEWVGALEGETWPHGD